jgi:hypothetical protein
MTFTDTNKALRGNSPQNPPHEGSTARACVCLLVARRAEGMAGNKQTYA